MVKGRKDKQFVGTFPVIVCLSDRQVGVLVVKNLKLTIGLVGEFFNKAGLYCLG